MSTTSVFAVDNKVFVGEWRLWRSQGGFQLNADGSGRAHAPSCSGNVRWSANDTHLKITYTSRLDCSIYDHQLGRQSRTMEAPAPDVIRYTLRKVTDSTYQGLPVMELAGFNETTNKKLTMLRPLVGAEKPKSKISRQDCRDKIADGTRGCDAAGGSASDKQMCKAKVMMKYMSCL
jgi:hypothetical protein